MFLYVSKHFNESQAGYRIVEVTCERCATEYAYELRRVGTGTASAPYYLGQDRARARASAEALEELREKLDTDVELVPCPKCRWINADCARRYRRHLYTSLLLWGWLMTLLGAVAFAITVASVDDRDDIRSPVALAVLLLAAILIFGPLWMWMVRSVLRARFNPNRLHPQPPIVPPGTPPAIVTRIDPRTMQPVTELVASDSGTGGRSPWVTIRPGELRWPPACCVCLEAPTTVYRSPFRVNEKDDDINVPLCGRCARRLRTRWYAIALLSAAVVAAVGGILAILPHKIDDFGRWAIFSMVFLLGAPVAAAFVPNFVCRPYCAVTVDKERGIVRYRFAHAGFTQLVREVSEP